MKLKIIFVMYLISAIVKGVIWAAAVEPVIQMLGLGSIFAAWNISKKSNLYDDFLIKSESAEDEDMTEEELKELKERWKLPPEYTYKPTETEKAHKFTEE